MAAPPRLVVRSHAPLRRALMVGGGLVVLLLAIWTAYEWGRGNAGFDIGGVRGGDDTLRDELGTVQDENRRLRRELAAGETQRVGQTREREELARTIGNLQAEVARLTRDLAFYRGVVGESSAAEVVLIQQFHVIRTTQPGQFHLRLVLGRPLRPEDVISGKARLSFEGSSNGQPATLDLAQVADVPGGELPFNYRYVQTLEQQIRLPAGFVPARTTVELLPARKGVNPVRESFLWTVENE